MKVAVLGGTGVFGSRLCRLLAHDGFEVVVVARRAAPAEALAAEIGAIALSLDRAADLSPLWTLGLDAVVDAAGPFHAYGDDPYRIQREGIAAGVSVLDLSDHAAFCAGVGSLDEAAKAAGVVILSGVSSVPALSSAAAAALAEGMEAVDLIDGAILPGNQAPRGRAVVESIVSQAGAPIELHLDGQSVTLRNWSWPGRYHLPGIGWRAAWFIEVPDITLFPDHFNARSVVFRAGLELGVMRWGLGALSWLRSKFLRRMPRWVPGLVFHLARPLAPFGTDKGGMVVRVVGYTGGQWIERTWAVTAKKGDGPFVPAVPARAVLRAMRDGQGPEPGARPALAPIPLDKMEAALEGLNAETSRSEKALTPLFPRALGPAFAQLPSLVQDSHQTVAPRVMTGRARVSRGRGLVSRLVGALFRFPAEAEGIAVEVTKLPGADREVWQRRFGDQLFRSTLRLGPQGLTERFGPLTFRLALDASPSGLGFPVDRGWAFGIIPIPRFLLPQVTASETERDGRFHFDVDLRLPWGTPIVRYQGWLEREKQAER